MRKPRHITAFFVSLAVALILSAGVFVAVVDRIGRDCVVNETWLPDVLKLKRLFASRTPSPRIILAAGSGTLFGVDSAVLSDALGLPVVNMALHAALPFEFYCEELRRMARPGDIVVMPLEISSFYHESFREIACRDLPLSLLFGAASEYQRCMPPGLRFSFYAHYGLEWICRNLRGQTYRADIPVEELERRWRGAEKGAGYGGYEYGGMTASGDMLVRRPSVPFQAKRWEVPSSPSAAFVDAWHHLSSELAERNVRLILTWSVLYWYPDCDGFEDFRQKLAAAGIRLCGRPEAFSFPRDCHYDTRYHLNAFGASLNAHELAKIVEEDLQRKPRLPAAPWPHVVFAEDWRQSFPDVENTEAYASGVRIPAGRTRLHVGVPEEMRGQALRLNFLVRSVGTNDVLSARMGGERLDCRMVPHDFSSEVIVSVPRRMTAAALDLDLTLEEPIGFERLTVLHGVQPLRYCSGFVGEWTVGDLATLELAVPDHVRRQGGVLAISLQPSQETVTVCCGEKILGRYELGWEKTDLDIPVPVSLTDGDVLAVQLRLENVKSPKERGWSPDTRPLGPRIRSVALLAAGGGGKGGEAR